jgi:uncharacterized membrane protein
MKLRTTTLLVAILASAPALAQSTAPSPMRGPEGTGNFVAGQTERYGVPVAGETNRYAAPVSGHPQKAGESAVGSDATSSD